MGKTRYIFSMGTLSRKDHSLCFKQENSPAVYIPVENTREIYCFNEVSLNTKLLDFLSKNRITLHIFNYYGHYSGTFFPKEHYYSGRLLVKQAQAYSDSLIRLTVAKLIVLGIGANIHEVLYHYIKHGNKDIKPYLEWAKNEFPIFVNDCSTINQLLQVEGDLWQQFYHQFQYIIQNDFEFTKRTKRPPENPLNALISFGNSLLYTKTISTIYHTHLDQRISFLHEPSDARFSLSLDLSEIFKPILVYKTIFELVNNKRIQVGKHFEKTSNYCLLNKSGKEIFISSFEDRCHQVFKHGKFNRMISYQTAIKLDCYKLIKFLLEDKRFEFYSLKEKK